MGTTLADYKVSELSAQQMKELVDGGQLDLLDVVSKNLWDGRDFMRRNAAHALRVAAKIPESKDNLLPVAAKDGDAVVREHVAGIFGEFSISAHLAAPALLRALADQEQLVAKVARESLDKRVEKEGKSLARYFVEALGADSAPVRLAASELLLRLQELGTDALVEALDHPRGEVRKASRKLLIHMGVVSAKALTKGLDEPLVRVAASETLAALASVPPEIRQELQKLAADASVPARAEAAAFILESLGKKGAPVPEPPPIEVDDFFERLLNDAELKAAAKAVKIVSLVAALKDGRAVVRANAAALLGLLAADAPLSAVAALSAAVKDEEADVRSAVVGALCALKGSIALGGLVKATFDMEPTIANRALEALRKLNPDAITDLLAVLASSQGGAAVAAITSSLIAMGKGGVKQLAEALDPDKQPHPRVRGVAASSLLAIGKDAAEAVPALINALSDDMDDIRGTAADALGFTGNDGDDVIQALRKSGKDGVLAVRKAATNAILRLRGQLVEALSARDPVSIPIDGFEEKYLGPAEVEKAAGVEISKLVACLRDGREMVRHNGAVALGLRGADAAEAVAPLVIVSKDANDTVRRAAVVALGAIDKKDDPARFSAIASALADVNPDVVKAAEAALAKLGEQVIPALVADLDGKSELAGLTVIPALANCGEAAVAPLIEALKDSSGRVRANAATCLGAIGEPAGEQSKAALEPLLKDPVGAVGAAAAAAIKRIDGWVPPPKAQEAVLYPIAGFETSYLTIEQLAAAFGQSGAKAEKPAKEKKKEEKQKDDGDEEAAEGDEKPKKEAAPVKEEKPPEAQPSDAGALNINVLTSALGDGRSHVRHNALLSLGLKGKEAAPALISVRIAIKDSVAAVRHAAAWAMGKLGTDELSLVVAPLASALGDRDERVVEAVLAAFNELGDASISLLIDHLDADDVGASVASLLVSRGPKAIDALVAGLSSQSANVRTNSAIALGKIGPPAKDKARKALVVAMADGDDAVRAAAKEAVDLVDDKASAPKALEAVVFPVAGFDERPLNPGELAPTSKMEIGQLIRALSDGRDIVRRNAAVALSIRGGDAAMALPSLLTAIKDGNADVRSGTLIALGAIAKTGELEGVAVLALALADKNSEVVAQAEAILEELGDAAIPGLITGLGADTDVADKTVIQALANRGEASIPPLLEALKNFSAQVRANAARSLGRIGPPAKGPAAGPLGALSGDNVAMVRREASFALDLIDEWAPAPKALEPIPYPIEEFEDRFMTEEELANALDSLGKDKKKAKKDKDAKEGEGDEKEEAAEAPEGETLVLDVPTLCRALGDGRSAVRHNALVLLGLKGAEAAGALVSVRVAIRDSNPTVRRASVETMGKLGAADLDAVVEPLATALHDRDAAVVRAARSSLDALGEAAIPALVTVLGNPTLENEVIDILAAHGEKAIEQLLLGLTDASSTVRANSATTLGKIGSVAAEKARKPLVVAMIDPDDDVKAAAKEAVAMVDGGAPPPWLAEVVYPVDGFTEQLLGPKELAGMSAMELPAVVLALGDGRSAVRHNALLSIGLRGEEGALALISMRVAIRDSIPAVRRAAAIALGQIGLDEQGQVVEALARGMIDRDPSVVEAASESLKALGEAAIPHLINALDGEAGAAVGPALATYGTAAIQPLIIGLTAQTAAVRESCAIALGQIGPEASEAARKPLVVAMLDPDEAVKTAAKEAIDLIDGKGDAPAALEPVVYPVEGFAEKLLGPDEVKDAAKMELPQLIAALSDGRAPVRHNAVVTIGLIGDTAIEALQALLVTFKDKNDDVRRAVVSTLGEIAKAGDSACIAAIAVALADPNEEVAAIAATVLEELGDDAIPGLIDGLAIERDLADKTVIAALAKRGEVIIDPLVGTLKHFSALVRANSARCLGLLGPPAKEKAKEPLVLLLSDPVKIVQQEAAFAIDELDGYVQKPKALEPVSYPLEGFDSRFMDAEELSDTADWELEQLLSALGDGRSAVRHNALVALGERGEEAAPGLISVRVAIRDGIVEVRRAAAATLGKMGLGEQGDVVAPLAVALVDRDKQVIEIAAAALHGLGTDAIPHLVGNLNLEHAEGALMSLLVEHGEAAIEPLIDGLKSLSTRVRLNSAITLGKIGTPAQEAARKPLVVAMIDPDDEVRVAAKEAVDLVDGKGRGPAALEPDPIPIDGFEESFLSESDLKDAKKIEIDRLKAALKDGREVVRHNAAAALGTLKGDAEPALWELIAATRDSSAQVRRAAVEALGAVGVDELGMVVFTLVGALADKDADVVGAASAALIALGDDARPGMIDALEVDPDKASATIGRVFVSLGDKAVDSLIGGLESDTPRVQLNSAKILGEVGPEAGEKAKAALTACLGSTDGKLRKAAQASINSIDGIEPEPAVREAVPIEVDGFDEAFLSAKDLKKAASVDPDRLIAALSDGRPPVRHNAAVVLGGLGDKAASGLYNLVVTLKDPNVKVRCAAAAALASLGVDEDGYTLWGLTSALDDPEPEVIEAVKAAIGALGDKALPGLIAALDTDPEHAAEALLPLVVAQGDKAIAPLLGVLDALPVHQRVNAVVALGKLGPDAAKSCRDQVEAKLKGEDHSVVLAAQEALKLLDGYEPPPEFLEAEEMPLKGFDEEALDEKIIKKGASKLDVDQLKRLVFDGRAVVRENAARGLGALGKAGAEASVQLVLALKDAEQDVRAAAAEALGSLTCDPDAAVPGLAAALDGASEETREAVFGSLKSYGKDIVAPLIGALTWRPEKVMAGVAPASLELSSVMAKPLAELLMSQEATVVQRENAADVLAFMGEEARSVEGLILDALEDRDALMRMKVINAVVKVAAPTETVQDRLKEISKEDSRPYIRDAIVEALQLLSG